MCVQFSARLHEYITEFLIPQLSICQLINTLHK